MTYYGTTSSSWMSCICEYSCMYIDFTALNAEIRWGRKKYLWYHLYHCDHDDRLILASYVVLYRYTGTWYRYHKLNKYFTGYPVFKILGYMYPVKVQTWGFFTCAPKASWWGPLLVPGNVMYMYVCTAVRLTVRTCGTVEPYIVHVVIHIQYRTR